MAERNRNKDFQEKVKKDQGRFQAYYYNNLELLDPANQLAGRPRKLTTLKSTTDLTTGRIANQLSLTDQFRIYSTVAIRSLYPGLYPGAMGSITRLTSSGTYRLVTVTEGAKYIRVYMWGSGGEGSLASNPGVPGGGGAYVEGYLPVTGGEVLRIIVGNRSGGDVNGGGGAGGGGGGSAGGGRTAVQRLNGASYEDVVVAGGGGGAGGGYPSNNAVTGGAATASGTSYAGRSEDNRSLIRSTAAYGQNGGGGGPSSGGIAPYGSGGNGTKGAGGPGGSNYTGGGGGGYYGGAGGQQSPPNHGSGGGGSSYPNLLVNFVGADGDGAIGGNSTSSLRINNAGDAGYDGLLYYQFYVNLP